jgi:transposase
MGAATGGKWSLPEGFDLRHLTQAQAEALYALGKEVVIFALLQLSLMVARGAANHPSTPSGQKPVYAKPNTSTSGGKKRPGPPKGHRGSRRKPNPNINRTVEHTLERCPDCGGPLHDACEIRNRVIEDIPEVQPETTEHRIHRYWCQACQKNVEPVVPDALPHATLGHRVVVLTAWLHYALGNTLSQILQVLWAHFHFPLTAGGLLQAWQRLATILTPWYEAIAQQALASAVLHADETGHRMQGQTHWLWCFTNGNLTFYLIDRSRGEEALRRFFVEAFQGVLITDFWAAYNHVVTRKRQLCLVHLLRELAKVDLHNSSPPWIDFRDRLKTLLKKAMLLAKERHLVPQEFARRRQELDLDLDRLLTNPADDPDTWRLFKRVRKYRHDLFTFLDEEGVAPDNNHAEREIRPAVLMRKNSFHNMSPDGAHTQAILMTIYRTLQRRGLHPLEVLTETLRTYVSSGSLPPLPDSASIG